MPRAIELSAGDRFGRLTVASRANSSPNRPGLHFHVRCDCGAELVVAGRSLRTGNSQSCGCLRLERVRAALTTHGESARGKWTPEFQTWASMRRRCLPNFRQRQYYADRGIVVCDRWASFRDVPLRHGAAPIARSLAGQNRQQRQLRAEQLPMGDALRAAAQQTCIRQEPR